MPSANLTRRALSLGGVRDVVSGLPPKVWTESTISGSIQNTGNSRLSMALGVYAKYPHTAFIPDVIRIGDELIDAQGYYYVVNAAEQLWRLNEFICYVCNCQKIDDHSDREATSGIWHLDSDALRTDNRYRNRLLLVLWFAVGANKAHLDDGVTDASLQVLFSGADYPLLLELLPGGNDVDIAITVEKASVTPRWNYQHAPYAYEETVKLELWSINKEGLTAMRLIDEVEEGIKYAFTLNATGSTAYVRQITRIDNPPLSLAAGLDKYTLYNSTLTVRYVRPNDDYVPTVPSITWGPSAAPTGTFIFPNVARMSPPTKIDLIPSMIPGRIGRMSQSLGMPDMQISMTCDLDIEHSDLTWMRPQTALPKTDKVPWQVFLDMQFNSQIDQEYQTLNLGWGGTIQVLLSECTPYLDGGSNRLDLLFYGYSSTSGSGGTYKAWLGIT